MNCPCDQDEGGQCYPMERLADLERRIEAVEKIFTEARAASERCFRVQEVLP